jgi:hypothetical protein
MTDLNVTPEPCPWPRCARLIFPVQIMKQNRRAAPVAEVLDAEPVAWEYGARIKLLPSGHLPHGQQLAKQLTLASISQAFAANLYVPHREVCRAVQRKTKRKVKGIAA